MYTVHAFGINFHPSPECDTGSLEICRIALQVVGLDKVMQVVYQAKSPGVLGCDLVLSSQLDALLIQG